MIRNRIKELRHVLAFDLRANPRNYRKHPPRQKALLKQLLSEVGYADALIAYEPQGELILIDGHLRAETTPDQTVPVLVLDVTEQEAKKLLLTLDPLAAMAETDAAILGDLMKATETSGELDVWLKASILPPIESGERGDYAREEWAGMPAFENEAVNSYRTLKVHLMTEQDFVSFCKLIGQEISPQAKYVYHPKQVRRDLEAKRWVSEVES